MYARYAFYLLSFCYFGFLVLNNLGVPELEFYDEARRGVNTLEMYSGQSHPLVPTFFGQPDHWGTKPPLLIWLQVCCTYLIGPGETAIRIPAAIATLLTIGLMTWFTNRQWKEPIIGILAGWVLLSNWNFVGNHGARSGDFDALVMLFGLAQLLFFARFVQTDKTRYLLLSAFGVLLAGWTKGIVGCFLLPAIAVYVFLDPKARKQLLNWRMYASYFVALLGILSYYLMREQLDPGYLQIVYENELGGRYLEANEGHLKPWFHYLEILFADRTFGGFANLFFPAVVLMIALKDRFPGAGLIAAGAIVFLAVLSTSATKLFWYVVPSLPLIALLVAGLLYSLGNWLYTAMPKLDQKLRGGLVVLALAGFFVYPVYQLLGKVQDPRAHLGMKNQISSYRSVIEGTKVPLPYLVIANHYHPTAQFYVQKEQLKGRDIRFLPIGKLVPPLVAKKMDYLKLMPGNRVMVCETNSWNWVSSNHDFREIANEEACKLIEIIGYKPGINPRHLPAGVQPPAPPEQDSLVVPENIPVG